jgi:hypothetical protein
MASHDRSIMQTVRKFWSALRQNEPAAPKVVVHDPSGQRAHDLDDPFYDDKVQSRIGGVIAGTGNRKTKDSY